MSENFAFEKTDCEADILGYHLAIETFLWDDEEWQGIWPPDELFFDDEVEKVEDLREPSLWEKEIIADGYVLEDDFGKVRFYGTIGDCDIYPESEKDSELDKYLEYCRD